MKISLLSSVDIIRVIIFIALVGLILYVCYGCGDLRRSTVISGGLSDTDELACAYDPGTEQLLVGDDELTCVVRLRNESCPLFNLDKDNNGDKGKKSTEF